MLLGLASLDSIVHSWSRSGHFTLHFQINIAWTHPRLALLCTYLDSELTHFYSGTATRKSSALGAGCWGLLTAVSSAFALPLLQVATVPKIFGAALRMESVHSSRCQQLTLHVQGSRCRSCFSYAPHMLACLVRWRNHKQES